MKTIRFAIKQIVPLIFSYVFAGIAFGILVHKAGYSVLMCFLSAVLIYAGSMQIIMVSLMASGIPLYMIGIMTFFINARHIFYGIGFIDKFRKMGWKYPFMVLTLTDETYSILCSVKYVEGIDKQKVDFYISLISYLIWIISCVAGSLFGEMIPFDMTGIEFCGIAFFVTICVEQWRQFNSHIPAIVGFISSIIFYILIGANNFILPALCASLIVLIIMKEKINTNLGEISYDN